MAVALQPLNRIKLFFQALSGSLNTELNEDEGYDKEELAEITQISAKSIEALEKRNGRQTMVVDDEKEEKDRLGIKKPKNLGRTQKREENTVEAERTQGSDDGRE